MRCRFPHSLTRPPGHTGACLWLLAMLFLPPAGATAQSGAHWRTNYYEVTGSSIREIRQSLLRNRPARVDREALTEWTVRARCGVSPFQGAYRCAGFNTTVTIRLTLPRWTPPEGVPEAVQEAWERYVTALTQHELGHAQFALSTAAELHRRVQVMGTAADPESMKARVQDLVAQTTEEFKEREREYDRLTDHGLEQGVALATVEEGVWEPGSPVNSERRNGGRRGRW